MARDLGKNDVENVAADIVEIDVDPVGTMRAQALANVLGLVVDRRIEPEFVDEVAALRGAAGDADRAASLDFCDLPDGRANRAGGAGNDDRITLIGRADIEQAK